MPETGIYFIHQFNKKFFFSDPNDSNENRIFGFTYLLLNAACYVFKIVLVCIVIYAICYPFFHLIPLL
jgi:hypothetical protein